MSSAVVAILTLAIGLAIGTGLGYLIAGRRTSSDGASAAEFVSVRAERDLYKTERDNAMAGSKLATEVEAMKSAMEKLQKEARAWTIHKGDTAPMAAGVIHTDFQKGFIKAEIVSFTDLIDCGSMAEAKAKGKVRMEGKDYVMADGDVVEFRFNV